MEGQENIQDARSYINDNIDRIEAVSEEVIKENGYDYPARAAERESLYPRRATRI